MTDFSDYINKSNRLLKTINKYALGIIVLGFLGILISPYLFTLPGRIDFSQTGDIGSTIGGITAPIVGIISVLLIYVSFYAQFHANQLQFRALLNEKMQLEDEKNIRFIEGQLKNVREVWSEFQNSIKIPLVDYEKKPELTQKIIQSVSHRNTVNHLLLLIDRIFNTLEENKKLYKDLKRRYIFSDILLLINETSGLFESLKTLLDKKYKGDPNAKFTSEMIDRIYQIKMKVSHIANRPENQDEIIEVLLEMNKIAQATQ